MDAVQKQRLLHWAELLDSYRIYPRFVIVPFVGFWVWKVTSTLINWYIHEPPTGRGTQESAVVTGTIAAMVGLITLVINTYSRSGRDWSQQTPVSTTTATVTSVTPTP